MLALLAMFGALSAPVGAQEQITRFDVTIRVEADGSLLVTENITAVAEGREIKRGIYRDIPLTFESADGASRRVGFDLLSIRRDGKDEAYRENQTREGVRIYIGAADTLLAHRAHTFTIAYRTTRQIRFFDDHDELYWNVTGQEWAFPIERATARITLPEGIAATNRIAFTGRTGDTGTDWTAHAEDGGNVVVFSTTRPLQQAEGFSVAVAMPKGTIPPPSAEDRARHFLLDHRKEIIAGIGILIVLAYFLWAWRRVGRDPPRGTIIPLFHAPDGVSPALADYIHNRGFSGSGWRALSAACINLAVKGLLEFDDLDDEITLKPTAKRVDATRLPRGEAAIIDALDGRPLTLSKKHGSQVSKLGNTFRHAITGENRNKFFKANTVYWVPGLVLSILTVAALLFFGQLNAFEFAFLGPISIIIGFFCFIAVKIAFQLLRAKSLTGMMQFILIAGFLGIFMSGIGAQIISFALAGGDTPFVPVIVASLFVINGLFYFIMGAPTAHGRDLMDQIEGLKLYLSVAERERMNMAGAPDMSPNRYETLLPYAVALEVEKPWSEAFQAWLAAAAATGAAAGAHYAPSWYHGRTFDTDHFGQSMSDTVNAMSQSFTSSLPTPKSSSSGFSGGGGGVGGGGGGGGGGGW
ncbi:DUF2207 domain-containing protein [Breoghania sp.]|uniref:DUF2207 domain-containing protein n=1 Tax=Breoghania sp. TaxID=2065378 RepID=UPI002AAAAAA8|nr:DUF2207 domain-containing protein [Breoghania sp.]